MGCCLQRENLPPTDLFNSKRFYQHKISTFRNNCPSGGVLLDPHFVKLGRRDIYTQLKLCRYSEIENGTDESKLAFMNAVMQLGIRTGTLIVLWTDCVY